MEIKKKYLMGLLALAVLIGVVSGAFIVRYTWQTNMSMELVESWELQLQYLNGTAISSYDWGLFNPGEEKQVDTQLNYTGNVNANVTWNTVNLPSGWVLMFAVQLNGATDPWMDGEYQVMTPGQVTPLSMYLDQIGEAVPNQPETFTVNWTANEYTP